MARKKSDGPQAWDAWLHLYFPKVEAYYRAQGSPIISDLEKEIDGLIDKFPGRSELSFILFAAAQDERAPSLVDMLGPSAVPEKMFLAQLLRLTAAFVNRQEDQDGMPRHTAGDDEDGVAIWARTASEQGIEFRRKGTEHAIGFIVNTAFIIERQAKRMGYAFLREIGCEGLSATLTAKIEATQEPLPV